MSVKMGILDFFKYIPGYTSIVALWITGSACYLLIPKKEIQLRPAMNIGDNFQFSKETK